MMRLGRLGTTLAMIALYAVTALISLRPVADRDVWWHLRTGEWIVQHGAVPHVDPFAAEGTAKAWRASSWLFETLLYELHRRLGLAALAGYALVLALACVLALQRLSTRESRGPITALALPALALAAVGPLLGPRPALASILFYAIELIVLFSALETGSRRGLWLLPPLFVVWANIDGGVGHGLLVLALATVAQRLERRQRPSQASDESVPDVAVVTLLCGVAVLVTPYHIGFYSTMLDMGGQGAARERLDDLMAPTFRAPPDWIMLGLLLSAAFVLARRSRHRTFMLFVLVVSAFAGFRASRDAWLVAVSATAVLSSSRFAAATTRWLPEARSDASGTRPTGDGAFGAPPDDVTRIPGRRAGALAGRDLLVAAVAAGIAGVVVWSLTPPQPRWEADVSARFPLAAAQVVDDRRYPGPLFSSLEWSGYLLWRLPRLSMAVDTRLDVLGDARVRRVIATWDGGRDWATDPDLATAGTVIAPADSSLTTLLHDDPRFVVVYTDDVAALFIARRAAHGSGS